jgi:TonB-dependent receptor
VILTVLLLAFAFAAAGGLALRRFFSAAASSSAPPDRLLNGSNCRGPDLRPGMTPPHAPRRSRTRVSLGAVLGVGLLLPAVVGAAESAPRAFDLPAGDAAVTLKAFAAQSGEQLLYSPDDVQGVRTPAVHGDFTPLAGLELLLAPTPLRVRQDAAARAFAITVRPPPHATENASRSNPPSTPTVKPKNPFSALGAWLALTLAPAAVAADTVGTIRGRVQHAATGQFLNNARVALKGTTLADLTDETGTYRIARVPAGPAVLQVFYTGLAPQEIAVTIPAGGATERDIELSRVAATDRTAETVKLDRFVVSSTRDTDAGSIAVNEQRFAPNLKHVINTDAFGDVTDGNVGEFLKFLPGISTDTDTNEVGTVTTVSVRGFPAGMTRISSDGAQLANTSNAAGNNRTFYFSQVSANNIARVEVTKAPTPATPADTMAGSVNLVSKSAFERKDAQFNYSLSLTGSSRSLSLQKEPFVNDRMARTVLPGVTLDYTLPVNRNFGVVVTGQSMDRHTDQTINGWTYNQTVGGATVANPYLQTVRYTEATRRSYRRSLAVKADWRVATHSVLSAGFQTSAFLNDRSPVDISINAGAFATPAVAGGKSLAFGPGFTSGATGRAAITLMGAADFQQPGRTRGANLRFRHDDGTWRIEASADYSISIGALRDTNASPSRFRQSTINFAVPVRVEFSDIGQSGPGTIRLFDNNERELSLFDIRNYRLANVLSTTRDFTDEMTGGRIDLRRQISRLPFPASLQIGAATREQARDVRRYSVTWNYTGPADLTPLLHTRYRTSDAPALKDSMPWPSVARAWSAWQSNPSLFSLTPAQIVAVEQFRILNSEFIQERVDAFYAMVEFRPVPRLTVLGGVRREQTTVEGRGPLTDPTAVWVRNANGSYARTAAGERIRKPEAGLVGSLQELALVRRERGFRGDRDYAGNYPSLHLTYSHTPNLLARAAFAQTYGRPDFTNIIPNTSITELDFNNDPNALDGRIGIRNPGLKPWSAKNYDISLEYYTPQGGLFSVGAFRKQVRDFFVTTSLIATEADLERFDLGPQYLGWEINSTANGGTSRTDGIEFNAQHSLQRLGAWGRPFQVFVNGSKLKLSGGRLADFNGFVRGTASWGASYSRERLKLIARWNHRGQRRDAVVAALGPDGANYAVPRTVMDLNAEFRFSPRLVLFAYAQNVLGVADDFERFGKETPAYARRLNEIGSGALLTLGVKGTF